MQRAAHAKRTRWVAVAATAFTAVAATAAWHFGSTASTAPTPSPPQHQTPPASVLQAAEPAGSGGPAMDKPPELARSLAPHLPVDALGRLIRRRDVRDFFDYCLIGVASEFGK